MNSFKISRANFSDFFWQVTLEKSSDVYQRIQSDILFHLGDAEKYRAEAAYNTGSIPIVSARALFSIAYQMAPAFVGEVGTFIGRTTYAVARGMDEAGVEGGEIHTCDFSNEIKLKLAVKTGIHQYPFCASPSMFERMVARGRQLDMLMVDGRLSSDDLKFLSKGLLTKKTVLALDDFEGVEKGVVNAQFLLGSTSIGDSHILIYPPTEKVWERFSEVGRCTVALLFPKSLLNFVAQ